MKKPIVIAAIAASVSAAVLICCGCAGNGDTPSAPPDDETKKVNVSFVLDREIIYSASVEKGETVRQPALTDTAESAFIVWTYNGSIFDFDRPIKCDTVLTATLSKKFSVNFKCDGRSVKICEYSYYDRTIQEPKVPVKKGYSGKWESYETTGGNITVNAVYTPVVYFIDYVIESTVEQTITCTIENYQTLIPEVPQKTGFTGKWIYEQLDDTHFTAAAEYAPKIYTANFYVDEILIKSVETAFNEELMLPEIPRRKYYECVWSDRREIGDVYEYHAIYTPVEYTVSFVADNVLIAAESYTVIDRSVTPPPVPEKPHYDGKWQDFSLNFEDITVNAEYSPTEYAVYFTVDGTVIDTQYYTVEFADVTPPALPEKEGYSGKWSDFVLNGGNVTVCAEYTAIKYGAAFIADGVLVAEIIYTLDNTEILPPEVPEKNGYNGAWQDYRLGVGGAVINCVYTPIDYRVTFIADGKIVAVKSYTVENKYVTPPDVPIKDGFKGKWEAFTLDIGDKVVNAEYFIDGYTVTFVADGKVVAEIRYDTDDSEITPPPVPDKFGFEGKWENYALGGNVTVHAVYTAKQYKVNFIADGQSLCTEYYTVDNKDITIPPVPVKKGYDGAWEYFELTSGDVTVNAVYTPEVYKVYFISDGIIIAESEYTVIDKNINIPEVPVKQGCESRWESFELTYGNVFVNAIFTPLSGTEGILYTLDGTQYTVTGYKGDDESVIIPSHYKGLPVTKIADNAFDCSGKNAYAFEEITICENVQVIGVNAFYKCTALKRVKFPDSLTTIKQAAFANCVSLESVELPDKITVIEEGTFTECGLKSVALPENLKSIGLNAFSGCTKLKEIVIPEKVTEINMVAFMNCTALEKVVFGESLTHISQYAFLNCPKLGYAEFKNADGWMLLKPAGKTDVSAPFADPLKAAEIIAAFADCEFKK